MAAHKNEAVIKAWAEGKVIHYRLWLSGMGECPAGWGGWRVLTGVTPTRTDIGIEYRIAGEPEPHKWQREREAFLAGEAVEFTDTSPETGGTKWHVLDKWLEAWCRSEPGGSQPIWDKELEFRIKHPVEYRYLKVWPDHWNGTSAAAGAWKGAGGDNNLRVTFIGTEIKEVAVLRHGRTIGILGL